jgi:hypothetical protein
MAQRMLAVEFEQSDWPWATKETGRCGWIPFEQLEPFVRGPAADKNERRRPVHFDPLKRIRRRSRPCPLIP